MVAVERGWRHHKILILGLAVQLIQSLIILSGCSNQICTSPIPQDEILRYSSYSKLVRQCWMLGLGGAVTFPFPMKNGLTFVFRLLPCKCEARSGLLDPTQQPQPVQKMASMYVS